MPIIPRRRPGRPTKQDEVREALAAAGCDPAAIDPMRILAGIAADETKPPTARVAACKVLLAARGHEPADDFPATGDLAARAIRLMATRRAN